MSGKKDDKGELGHNVESTAPLPRGCGGVQERLEIMARLDPDDPKFPKQRRPGGQYD